MQTLHWLATLAAIQIGMNHFADDRTGANNGYLHDDIVKTFWLEARQAGHLCAAFHLKQADCVCTL